MNSSSAKVLFAILLLATLPVSVMATPFSDGDFLPENWAVTSIVWGAGGTAAVWTEPSGGTPGAHRVIEIHVLGGGDYSGVYSLHEFLPETYDPAVQGALTSIDYSEDAMHIFGVPLGQATGPCIWQDGNAYVVWTVTDTLPSWHHIVLSDLQAADFSLIDPSIPPFGMDVDRHPDFSDSAGVITLGFMRLNNTSVGHEYHQCGALDNWSVAVHPDLSAVGPSERAAERTTILWASPNPCSQGTQLVYTLAADCPITVSVRDICGRRLVVLAEGFQRAGTHSWSFALNDANGIEISAGVYFLHLQTPQESVVSRLMLVR